MSGPSSLVFTPVHLPQNAVDSKRKGRRLSNTSNDDANGECPSGTSHHEPSTSCRRISAFEVSEQPVRYDHRSFAANVFGTAAFKMLEWLAPQSFEGLTKKAQAMSTSTPTAADNEPGVEHGEPPTRPLSRQGEDSGTVNSQPRNDKAGPKEDGTAGQSGDAPRASLPASSSKPKPSRRNSNAKVRATSTKPIRRLSTDPFVPAAPSEDTATIVSPRIAGIHPEKLPRPPKATQAATREISIVPSSPGGSSDDADSEKLLGGGQDPTDEQMTSPEDSAEEDATDSHASEDDFGDGRLCARLATAKTPKDSRKPVVEVDDDGKEDDTETSMIDAALLPQTLGRLNLEIIEFLFSVLREDSTSELPLVPARGSSWQLQSGKYRRMPVALHPYPMSMKVEWKRFVEQSVFYVMSDPHSLVRSFTQDGKLVDSRNLWRCMVRLTDTTPSLVFHSLWIAISGLFVLPKHLQPAQLAGSKAHARGPRSLSNTEAAYLVSICFHALAAAAPEVSSRTALLDMSRLRSSGVALSGNGGPRLPASLCLQYDDTFSNDLTLRLAKRLFSALVARKHFASLAESEGEDGREELQESNVLNPLLNQMDFLNSDTEIGQDSSPMPQALPILLLDWARAVIMQEWDGHAVFNPDSAFGGAVLFIEAMCRCSPTILSE